MHNADLGRRRDAVSSVWKKHTQDPLGHVVAHSYHD